jgi:hypothetical protein
MLPFQNRTWAKPVARVVILVSFFGLSTLAYLRYRSGLLDIPEAVGIVLLMLLFLPPNIAILTRPTPPPTPAADPSATLQNHSQAATQTVP